MRLILAQIAPRLGRLDENIARHRDLVAHHRGNQVDLVVFPELSLTGYQLKDLVSEVSQTPDDLIGRFDGLGEGRPVEIVVGFLERSAGHQVYNSLAHLRITESGRPEILHVHRKLNLPTYGMFEEERYFNRGITLRSYASPLIGRCGLMICEDLWHPANALLLSLDGPDLEGVGAMIVASNSPARGLRGERDQPMNAETWTLLARQAALTHHAAVILCQRVGAEEGFVFVGGSKVVAPDGAVIAEAPLFDEHELSVEIDLTERLRRQRLANPKGAVEDFERLRRELERIAREHV